MARFKNGAYRRRRWPYIILFSFLAIVTFALVMAVSWYQAQLRPLSSDQTPQVVTIAPGSSTTEIGKLLERNGLIRSAVAFEWYVRINQLREDLQAGSYSLSPSMSVGDLTAKLIRGEVAVNLVTILPAQRLDQIKESLLEAGYSEQEIATALDPNTHAGHPALSDKPPLASLEGYLYPESFQKTAETPLSTIIEQSLDLTEEAFTPEIQQALQARGLDKHQAIILASIVEREVSRPEDRTKVAQVFLKRLEIGMMLGSDPTALYGALLAGIEPSVRADTPYNTRLYTGLPPGPINNISYNSLEALAFPSNTDYLYFVSGDDGNTYFSRTLEEHEALTAQHCIELCKSY